MAVAEIKTFLTGKPGVTITEDASPDSITCQINHATGLTRKSFMNEMMKHKVWLLSLGTNAGTKTYKIAESKPTW